MRPAKGHRLYPSIALPSTQSLDLGALSGTIWQKKASERPVIAAKKVRVDFGQNIWLTGYFGRDVAGGYLSRSQQSCGAE